MKHCIHPFFLITLCFFVYCCNKYDINIAKESFLDKEDLYVMDTKSNNLLDSLSGFEFTKQPIRININTLEQLSAIEQDTSIVIFHYCTPEDQDNPQPFKYSPQSRGGEALVCDAEAAPDIYLYPVDVFWPSGKSIPDTIKYEVLSDTISSATRYDHLDPFPLQPASLRGQVRAYDNRLLEYVPVRNATIKYYQKLGSNEVLQYTSTDSQGNFIIEVPAVNRNMELVLQNANYIVRNGNTSEVKSISLGAPSFDYFGPLEGSRETEPRIIISPTFIQRDLPSNFFLDVYQAAHYYYYGSNELLNQVTRYSSASALSIFAVNGIDVIDNSRGLFSYYQSGSPLPYVTIYNPEIENYIGAASKIFGTVLHELGHATHYTSEGSVNFDATDDIITESFASFFGWLNVLHYYSSIASTHGNINSICTQGRQSWQAVSDTLIYTPFYIDLYDNYNQSLYYSSPNVVNDEISNVPVSIILSLVFEHSTFSTVYNQLASYINQWFTLTEYNDFATPYSIFL